MSYPWRNIFIHLWGTAKHKFWVAYYIIEFILDLLARAFLHDLSKYSKQERTHFFKIIHRLKSLTYGSDEYQECLDTPKPALDHHPEHYDDVSDFNLADLVEMFCDWRAAVRRHNDGDIHRSIEINKDRFGLDEQLCCILRNSVKISRHN